MTPPVDATAIIIALGTAFVAATSAPIAAYIATRVTKREVKAVQDEVGTDSAASTGENIEGLVWSSAAIVEGQQLLARQLERHTEQDDERFDELRTQGDHRFNELKTTLDSWYEESEEAPKPGGDAPPH